MLRGYKRCRLSHRYSRQVLPQGHQASPLRLARFFLGRLPMTQTVCTLPSADLLPFLVLRQMAGGEQGSLANHLLKYPDLAQARLRAPWSACEFHVSAAQRQYAALTSLGIHTVMVTQFPRAWLAVRPLPAALFVRGDPNLLGLPGFAIVGSRSASRDAFVWTVREAKTRAARGEIIISGGALGIDTAAHLGALEGGGRTVAYLGCPIDQPYPVGNTLLFSRMLMAGGALASEHPPCVATQGYHHAARNRFIATHAQAVLVVEAAARSGSLGTASFARRLQRPIYVSPSHVGRNRAGLAHLLKQTHATIYSSQAPQAALTSAAPERFSLAYAP